jgi:hypothetical protein
MRDHSPMEETLVTPDVPPRITVAAGQAPVPGTKCLDLRRNGRFAKRWDVPSRTVLSLSFCFDADINSALMRLSC